MKIHHGCFSGIRWNSGLELFSWFFLVVNLRARRKFWPSPQNYESPLTMTMLLDGGPPQVIASRKRFYIWPTPYERALLSFEALLGCSFLESFMHAVSCTFISNFFLLSFAFEFQRLPFQTPFDWRLRCRKVLFAPQVCRRHLYRILHLDNWSGLCK